ncbi:DUF775-domain-containing protein [Metschnikowia bicuspidata var. bicuspidata NRRL YB-4993]|uniref:DUF775-domain-containing protein n=1 Tax=Metschnikowia bicuspidata var. bicuspidata NRRL YB-4993 TaxID=869754 RepID=A0A1A0HDL5_9ASCO|nr:DUF775-domain-containing protein [Metschnikowia bicuspidata var. bicuspidata NRRL YB-4993]OBA21987.1 DUF775-domain-containing protein [Metschnikowia bicuspidata var. bicuspidata NRRL YB-4993]
MFGAVCSGRPMQLAQQVEPTKYVFSIPNAGNISHVAVFMLPQTEFVDLSFTALVYFQLPALPEFKLLGGLNPNKPSSIFRLKNAGAGLRSSSHTLDEDDMMNDAETTVAGEETVLNIGISIEPTVEAEVLLQQERTRQKTITLPPSQAPAAPKAPLDIAVLANQIVKHAYNYLGGFIDATGKVPMKVFDNWWDKFRMKLSNNPNFLSELD